MSVVMLDIESGLYVATYDPHFVPPPPHPRYPSGVVTTTADITKALRFPSTFDALDAWRTQSSTVPLRPDGRPNRPLSSRMIEFVTVDE